MGASMGGMIVQTMAIEHPTRVRSLTSVMSTTGDPTVGQAAPEVLGVLLSPPATTREAYIEDAPKWMAWQSKKHRDAERTKALAAIGYDRSNYGEGGPRQMAAIVSSGDRTERLRQLDVPTLVIHGRDDTLITPSGGFATAEAIPGAHLLYLADMGHDIPEPLWPRFVDAVATHIRSA
jgi:pimeloyl-ACP methyl ester carboxylesterase